MPWEAYGARDTWTVQRVRGRWIYSRPELGLRPVHWLRACLAMQRTKRFHSPRQVSYGPMLGITIGKLETKRSNPIREVQVAR